MYIDVYIYIYVENCIVNPNGHQSIKLGFWAVTSSDLEKHMSWGSRKTSGKSTKPLTRFLFGVWRWLPAEPTTDVTIYILLLLLLLLFFLLFIINYIYTYIHTYMHIMSSNDEMPWAYPPMIRIFIQPYKHGNPILPYTFLSAFILSRRVS